MEDCDGAELRGNRVTGYNAQLAEAYREHRELIYRVAVARLRGAGLAGDAQDVVSKAVLSLVDHPVIGVVSWRALLIDAVEKKALDHIRSAWVKHRDGRELEPQEVEDDRHDLAEAEEAIDTIAAMQAATDALNSLPEPQLTVARECLWRERKQSEVAAELGVSQARVSQLLSAAKRTIRERLMKKGVQR